MTEQERSSARLWRATVRNFLTLVAGESVARAFGLVTVLVLARELTPVGLGIVSIALAVTVWVGLVADAGTELLSTRDVAESPGDFRRIAEVVVGLRLTTSVVCALALAGAALVLVDPDDRDVYLLFALLLPAAALNLRWITMGVKGARPITIGNVVSQVALMLGALLLVSGPDDTSTVAVLYVVAELIYAGTVFAFLVPRFGILRPRVDLARWAATLRSSLPLMVSNLARGALGMIDLLAIAIVLGAADAGQFSAGSRPALFLLTAVGLYFYSFVVTYSPLRGDERLPFVRRSVRTALAVSVPIAALLSLFAGPLVDLLFGTAYDDAALVLAIFAWKIPASAVGTTFSGILLARGDQRALMWNYVLSALVGVVLVALAAPLLGLTGVAVASVVSSVVVMLLAIRAASPGGVWEAVRLTLLPSTRARGAGTTF